MCPGHRCSLVTLITLFKTNPATTGGGHSIITYRTATLFMCCRDVGMRFKWNTDIDYSAGTYTCFRGLMSTGVQFTWPAPRRCVVIPRPVSLELFFATQPPPHTLITKTEHGEWETSLYWTMTSCCFIKKISWPIQFAIS